MSVVDSIFSDSAGSPEFQPFALNSEKASPEHFWQLMKPGVMTLVVFSAFVGTLLAPGSMHPFLVFVSTLSIALGSGAAAVFNMWYDRDIDSIMVRTKKRPLPAGLIAPDDALTFGVLLTLVSLLLMFLSTNALATGILAFSIFFYVVIYTFYLKRATAQNIVIGGAAGAFPPVIGWAAKTGDVTLFPWLLFLLVFIWTPSHFWALALYRHDDYRKAGVPMLPVTAGLDSTKRQILVYSVLLLGVSLAPCFMGYLGHIYGFSAGILGACYIFLSMRLFRPEAARESMQLFGYSILYLFVLLAMMLVDKGFAS